MPLLRPRGAYLLLFQAHSRVELNREEGIIWEGGLFNLVKTIVHYVVLGPRKSPMPLVRVFSENDKIFRQEKKYVE